MTPAPAAWHFTFYIANRFGSMQERSRTLDGNLSLAQAQRDAQEFITNLQRQGRAIYPHYDLERVAA